LRPGYWAEANPDWDWIPAHYCWTPSGYVLLDGYYDYTLPRRGLAFAPVWVNATIRSQSQFAYSPFAVLNLLVLENHLFVRSTYGHYYFGDYYASNYANRGFVPCFCSASQPNWLRSPLRQAALATPQRRQLGTTGQS
jgi:hypothetical protein